MQWIVWLFTMKILKNNELAKKYYSMAIEYDNDNTDAMFNMGIKKLNKDQFKMLQNKLIDTFKEYVLPTLRWFLFKLFKKFDLLINQILINRKYSGNITIIF